MSRPRTATTWLTCDMCGKRSFPDRRTTKRAARIAHPAAHMQVYECEPGTGRWHYGNPTGGERRRAGRLAPPTPSAVDPNDLTVDREAMMRKVLPALVALKGQRVRYSELAELLGYEPEGEDCRNVRGTLRLLERRGLAVETRAGFFATRAAEEWCAHTPTHAPARTTQ